MKIYLNYIEINFLLFGTNSIFHNDGLCIYGIKSDIERHKIIFKQDKFENISLTNLEQHLNTAPDTLTQKIMLLKTDAISTAKKYIKSLGREGLLLSHENLNSTMIPHIHRCAYAYESLPCLTIHYNLGNKKTKFIIYDEVDQKIAIQNDLCARDKIKQWCENKSFKEIELKNPKNVILFDSAKIPHCVQHENQLNLYFIFDHVKLINEEIYNSSFAIISNE